MKRAMAFLLAVMMTVSLCACGTSGAPQAPTEPEKWTITSQYVAGKIAEFTATDTYRKMVDCFISDFSDVNAKLIVRRPYLDAAIEYYLNDPQCHLLIMALRGDFGAEIGYSDKLILIYDMDAGIFYDSMNQWSNEYTEQYASDDKIQCKLLSIPYEKYTTLPGNEPIWTQFELYSTLPVDGIVAVNTALGVEEPLGDIQYEHMSIDAETEPPAEPETQAMVDVTESVEAEAQQPVEEIPQGNQPAVENGELSVSNQLVIDALRNIQNTKHYQTYADDPSAIGLHAAYEYYLEDFEGFEVHLIMLRVTGIDTDLHGFSSNVFLVNPDTGVIYSEFDLGLDYTGNIGKIEDTYVAILCSSFWQGGEDVIWSEMEQLTSISQSDLDAVNNALK